MRKNKIALVAGGTGGHLFPAIALAEEINLREDTESFLITDLRCQKYLPKDFQVKYHIIDIYLKFDGIFNKIKSLFQICFATIKSLFCLFREKPQILIGFGGYPSFPVMLAALILRIPVAIHEQNCFMGRVNKFFAKYSKIISLSYEYTANLDNKYYDKSVIVGNLIRKSIKSISKYNSKGEIFYLSIIGGSQGASFFSDLLPKAIKILLSSDPSIKLQITHQVAKSDQKKVELLYKKLGITSELSDFFKNMEAIYDKTHLMIARSGAGAISEITHNATPAIYIPYPYAKDDHQFFNALAIEKKECGVCFRQEDITPKILSDYLLSVIKDRNLLQKISDNLAQEQKKDSAKYLTDTILQNII